MACAVVGRWKLEDRGASRERLFYNGRLVTPQASPDLVLPPDAPAEALAKALRDYRGGEDRSHGGGGQAAGGYGAGGPAGFFLDPEANARLLDPYDVVSDALRINQAAEIASSPPVVPARAEAALAELERLARRDPKNPSILYWKGRLLAGQGRQAEAEAAFRAAVEAGREDVETTLFLADAVAAQGRVEEAVRLVVDREARLPLTPACASSRPGCGGLLGSPRRLGTPATGPERLPGAAGTRPSPRAHAHEPGHPGRGPRPARSRAVPGPAAIAEFPCVPTPDPVSNPRSWHGL